jgi:signal transduction histidine kinase
MFNRYSVAVMLLSVGDLGRCAIGSGVDNRVDLRLHPSFGVVVHFGLMVSGPASEGEGLGSRPSVARTLRWTLPLAVVAVGFLAWVTFRAHPAPGLRGQGLTVTAALVLFGLALVGFERVPARSRVFRIALVGAMVVCASSLFALQPDGPGFLMMFPPLSAAAFRFSRPLAVLVAAVGLAALAVSAWLGHGRPLDSVILDELAVAAYFGVAVFAGRFIVTDAQSQLLIDQLEQTRAAQAEAAALAERQRLAREMHDVLAHSLSGLVLNLEGARLMAEKGVAGPGLRDAISRSHSLAKTGLEEARRAIGLLRDDALPGPQRLAALASDFQADTGVPCRFVVRGDEHNLASDTRLTLYRVTQEALTNIRKHACPDHVEVRLTYEPDGTRLAVQDHRLGGDPPQPGDGTGYGLTGMRERAELLGGSLEAGSTQGGFRVELWAPS